jgi:hypothetical protein
MRGVLRAGVLAGLTAGLVGLGCHQDKYALQPLVVEEYKLPPDEARYNKPDTAGYRKPPPKPRDEKNMKDRPGGFNKTGDPNGF